MDNVTIDKNNCHGEIPLADVSELLAGVGDINVVAVGVAVPDSEVEPGSINILMGVMVCVCGKIVADGFWVNSIGLVAAGVFEAATGEINHTVRTGTLVLIDF